MGWVASLGLLSANNKLPKPVRYISFFNFLKIRKKKKKVNWKVPFFDLMFLEKGIFLSSDF